MIIANLLNVVMLNFMAKIKMWNIIKCRLGYHDKKMIGTIDGIKNKNAKYNVEICKHCKRIFVTGDNQNYPEQYVNILIEALNKIPEKDLNAVSYKNTGRGWKHSINGVVVSDNRPGYYLNGIRITSDYGVLLIRTIERLKEKQTKYEMEKEIKNCILKMSDLLNIKVHDYSIKKFVELLKEIPLEYIDRCYLQRNHKIDKYYYPALIIDDIKILYSGDRGSVYINEIPLNRDNVSLVLDAVKTVFERYDEEATKNCIFER